MPIAKCDLAKVAAAGDADASTFLLAAINPVRKLIVSDHVIELRGWLVVPGTPGLAAIHADGNALIDGQGNDLRILRIDPNCVIVISAGSAFDCGEVFATVR